MTQKEKAKAYDEVVNKLRGFIRKGVDPLITRADVQDFFPELKKSEDGRIKKGIISILKHYKENGECICPYPFVSIDEAIEWLGEQGELRSSNKVEPKFNVGDLIRLKNDDDSLEWTIKEIHHDGYYTIVCGDKDDFIYLDNKWELVWKNVDKVESKFYVSD